MPLLPVPIPTTDAWVHKDLTLSEIAIKYLTNQGDATTAGPRELGSGVTLTLQGASIGSTSIYSSAIPAGLYRISYYARITRAATTSSSLTIAFDWTDGGVGQTFTGAAITGNTTTTYQQASVTFRSDGNVPITYSTTYVSVGATSMQHNFLLVLEQLNA